MAASSSTAANSFLVASRSGMEIVTKINMTLLASSYEQNQIEVESLCKVALLTAGRKDLIDKHEATKSSTRKVVERSVFEILPSISTANQMKNHAIRFQHEEQSTLLQRQAWLFAQTKSKYLGPSKARSRDYENVLALDILRAPIVDICIVQVGDPLPSGYYRVARTPGNRSANLNTQSGGNQIFLCIKKDMTSAAVPITALIVIFPDKNEFVPPGYFVVRRGKHACNLNIGTSADRIFLCYKKDKAGNPITDLQMIFPKYEEVPRDFCLVEHSPTGIPANLNSGVASTLGVCRISLCYRQLLVSLSCLENDTAPAALPSTPTKMKRAMSQPSHMSDMHGDAGGATADKRGGFIGSLDPTRLSFQSSDQIRPTSFPASGVAPGPAPVSASVPPKAADGAVTGDSSGDIVVVEDEDGNSAPPSDLVEDIHDDIHDDVEDVANLPSEDEEAITVESRSNLVVVDVDGIAVPRANRRALNAVLAAISVRQSDMAKHALAGLLVLLKDTDFFVNDLKHLPLPGSFTLLDLTVETVCTRFDNCQETEFDVILPFLRALVKHSNGKLSLTCTQRIFKSLAFLCNYFSTRTGWMLSGYPSPCMDNGMELPAFKVLKEFVWSMVSQVELVDVASALPDVYKDDFDYSTSSEAVKICRGIAVDFVEDILDSTEVCRYTTLAQGMVAKRSSSTSSEQFWDEVSKLARKMFSETPYRTAFVGLAALCKLAWQNVRRNDKGLVTPRDLGSKLLAIDALTEFCISSGEKMKCSKVMGYQIRRLVVPCLLQNIPIALSEHRVFAKLLRLMTALWKSWRFHIRIEFAILVEHFVVRILDSTSLKVRPVFQMAILQEIVTWFDQPHHLVEMFVNFDMDGKFVSHWNIFSDLVSSICSIARRCALVTGAWDWTPPGATGPTTILEAMTKPSASMRDVNMFSIEEVSKIAKTIMDAAGHAHLILIDSDFRSKSLHSESGWEEDHEIYRQGESSLAVDMDTGDSEGSSESTKAWSGGFTVRYRRALHLDSEELLQKAVSIYEEKASIHKAIKFLVSKGFLQDTPEDIACFLRVYKSCFDPAAIGDFLGEGGVREDEIHYWAQIRFRYVRAVSFVDMELEPALRLFLTGCGFRLPGEAQKIDRFVEVFQKTYWADNQGSKYCPLRHPDTVHLLTFAIIMLNTDLHRVSTDKKKRKKMTKEEFIKNLRGSDQGQDIDKDFLSRTYDSILSYPIQMAVDSSESKGSTTNALQSATGGVGVTMSQASATAAAATNVDSSDAISLEEIQLMKNIARSVRDAEDLLRSLARYTYPFQLTGVDTKISLDLVSYMFESVAHHFAAITNELLGPKKYESCITIAALDILCYSLTSAIFLDFREQRNLFADQLLRFHEMCIAESRSEDDSLLDTNWHFVVTTQTNAANAMESIASVHTLMVVLKDAMQEIANAELTRTIASRIDKKALVMENNTFYVKDGDLSRKNKQGKLETRKFFLFSDELLTCHQPGLLSGEYKLDEKFSLMDISVADVQDDPYGCSLYVTHPTRPMLMVFSSPQLKHEWLRDLQQAIVGCKKRTAAQEAVQDSRTLVRKMSIFDRLEDQQQQQNHEHSRRAIVSPHLARSRSTTITPFIRADDETETTTTQASDSPVPSLAMPGPTPPSTPLPAAPSTPPPHSHGGVGQPITPSAALTPQERANLQQEKILTFKRRLQDMEEKSLNALYQAGVTFWKGLTDSRGAGGVPESVRLRMLGLQKLIKSGPFTESVESSSSTGVLSPAHARTASSHASMITGTGLQVKGSIQGRGGVELLSTAQQLEAWKQCGDMSASDAKKEFLDCLFVTAPYWKYEQFM